jgi:hypothetical protein
MRRGTPATMIVDDVQVDTMAIRRSPRELDIAYPVVAARNGIEALDHPRAENGRQHLAGPVLMLLDFNTNGSKV